MTASVVRFPSQTVSLNTGRSCAQLAAGRFFVVPFFVLCHRALGTKVSDPDPAFFSCYGSGSSSGSRVLMTKNSTADFLNFDQIAIYSSLGLHKRTSELLEKASALKREHSAL